MLSVMGPSAPYQAGHGGVLASSGGPWPDAVLDPRSHHLILAGGLWRPFAPAGASWTAAAGAVCALVLTITPWVLPACLAVAALGWARVHLGEHDLGQVTGGAVVGATVTTVVMMALT